MVTPWSIRLGFLVRAVLSTSQVAIIAVGPAFASVLFAITGIFVSVHTVDAAHVTPTVVATVALPLSSESHFAVNAVTNRIYVAPLTMKNLSVIDGTTHTLMQTVPLAKEPCSIA